MSGKIFPAFSRFSFASSVFEKIFGALALLIFVWISTTTTVCSVMAAQPPNIILILTDDQRWDTLSYMPTVQAQLVNKGITFTNMFANTSNCCPSRGSILTGQYTHNHSVLSNDIPNGGATNFHDISTLAVWLNNAGYKTALVGKYMNAYTNLSPYIPPGWNEWQAFISVDYFDYTINENGTFKSYGADGEDYSTDVLATKAVSFIRNSAASDKPFFLYFAPNAPHAPYTPAARHVDHYAGITPWRPTNYNESDVSDKPAWVRSLSMLDTDKQVKVDGNREQQLEALLGVDEALDSILQALKDTDQKDNTVVIFMSDNGYSWGEHRWAEAKTCVYEECMRLPLVIYYPGVTTPGQEARQVQTVDLAPTIAAITGVKVPHPINGLSLLPLLRGDSVEWRKDILLEGWPTNVTRMPVFGAVRTPMRKYVENMTGEKELYDLKNDPFELNNRISNPDYSNDVASLAATLRERKYSTTGMAPYLLVRPSFKNNTALRDVGVVNLSVLRTDMSVWPNQYVVQRKNSSTGKVSGKARFRTDYLPQRAAAVLSVDGNENAEVAMLSLGGPDGSPLVEVRDSVENTLVRELPFNAFRKVVSLDIFPDVDGNGASEVVLLGELQNDEMRVEMQDIRTGQARVIPFTSGYPLEISPTPDLNGDSKSDLLVLTKSSGDVTYQTIDPRTLKSLSTATLPALSPLGMTILPDANANATPEVAVLYSSLGKAPLKVLVADTKTGKAITTLTYNELVYASKVRALWDISGNGVPEVAVLGVSHDRKNQVVLKDVKGSATKVVTFDPGYLIEDLEVVPDITGNGKPELAVLLADSSSGRLFVQLRDAYTGEWIRDLSAP